MIKLPSRPPEAICIAPINPFARPVFSLSTVERERTTTFEITKPFPKPYMKQATARVIGKDKDSIKQTVIEKIAKNDQQQPNRAIFSSSIFLEILLLKIFPEIYPRLVEANQIPNSEGEAPSLLN